MNKNLEEIIALSEIIATAELLNVDAADEWYKKLCDEVKDLATGTLTEETKIELKTKGMRLHDATMKLISKRGDFNMVTMMLISKMTSFKVSLESI